MPVIGRKWSEIDDLVIVTMRTEGATWKQIGVRLGCSTFMIRQRARKLKSHTAGTVQPPAQLSPEQKRSTRGAATIPAGDSLTWNLISNDPYPYSFTRA